MKTISILLLILPLNGCFFFMIPGSAVSAISDGLSGSFGNACINSQATIGSKVRTPGGGSATVEKISGPSTRCQEATPIRAQVSYD